MMRILSVGGGSGGHVTPVLAVINELKRLQPAADVRFICDKSFYDQATKIMRTSNVKVTTITSGKLRRYHAVSWWKQLLDLPTVAKNLRDLFKIVFGAAESFWILLRWRPDVVFTKGGYVCLPVGWAAHVLRIPLVIHDSDAHPGLTNRILSRWATMIATGAPLEHYSYPKGRSRYVGIPIDTKFRPLRADEIREAKAELGFPDISRPLVVVTGGGLGARRINEAMVKIGDRLIEQGISVLHMTGQAEFHSFEPRVSISPHYHVVPFVSDNMATVLGAADVVVTRAGATTILELAALHKATIIIPNPYLTGGHQLKNAKVYVESGGAEMVEENSLESKPTVLLSAIVELVGDKKKQAELGTKLGTFARPDAALDVATMIVNAIKP